MQMVKLYIFTAVNVLRMIKLFGWERRVSERIQGKRNDELGWLWKLKVGRITYFFFLPAFLYQMLGVRDTECDRKVSVADYVIVLFRKNSKVLQ